MLDFMVRHEQVRSATSHMKVKCHYVASECRSIHHVLVGATCRTSLYTTSNTHVQPTAHVLMDRRSEQCGFAMVREAANLDYKIIVREIVHTLAHALESRSRHQVRIPRIRWRQRRSTCMSCTETHGDLNAANLRLRCSGSETTIHV